MSHGDLRLLLLLRILLFDAVGPHLYACICCCLCSWRVAAVQGSLASVDAGTLPSLPTGGRGASHLGDVDRALSVCCDADPGAEDSFTVPEGDTQFLGVVLVWAHIIDDAYGPDALDEHVVSWDDGSGGYSHHDYCFYLLLIIWLLVEGVSLGFVFADGTICCRGFSAPFFSCRGVFWV